MFGKPGIDYILCYNSKLILHKWILFCLTHLTASYIISPKQKQKENGEGTDEPHITFLAIKVKSEVFIEQSPVT